jgi:UDP-3-O-[3-hydroxymyristoyl] glucosamine N-acyltransferase
MKNQDFSLAMVISALRDLGISHSLMGQAPAGFGGHPAPLRFCSLFAQERGGIYFWEGEGAPAFDHADIVVLCRQALAVKVDCQLILADPQRSYYRLMRHFFAEPAVPPGIHPTAIVSPQARIGAGSRIGPYCVIGECEIGAGCDFDSHVVVKDGSVVGDRVRIESHSTIGATGVAWVWDDASGERIVQPQIGGARVGDDCFLGTDVTVVRGSINEVTSLGAGCVVAHGSKIGHGSVVGAGVHMANNVSIAGNCRVGDRAFLSAACVLRPRVRLARGVTVGAGAVVTKDFDEEGVVVSGVPARPMRPKDQHAGVPRAQAHTPPEPTF